MFEELKDIVGESNFSDSDEELQVYSRDSSFFYEIPLCVVRPKTREEVLKIVSFASRKKIPLIPRGAGTNPCGEVVGKAIILDLSRMDSILEINPTDMYVVVEPGVVCDDLNSELKKHNLFFPPDPASSRVATIGGMVSNNSSGLHAVKYGTTKDYVLSLEVVAPPGKVIETGTYALKSSSGYDLKSLFVGSEGTLGVYTKITLHLLPLPERTHTTTICLTDLDELDRFQKTILSHSPTAFEFMDELCLKAISERYKIDFEDAKALLIVEFQGSEHETKRGYESLKKIFPNEVDIPDVWSVRKGLVPLLSTLGDEQPLAVTEDIGVPISMVTQAIHRIKQIYGKAGYEVAVYGHIGDGNLHMRVFGEQGSELMQASDEVYSYVISIDGAISSEHGIGRLRAKYMQQVHGEALNLMKGIRRVVDEDGILNPGCLFD